MRIREDQCVGCPSEMGCMGRACRYKNVEVIYCDWCGAEIYPDDVHEVDGEDLCDDCFDKYEEAEEGGI